MKPIIALLLTCLTVSAARHPFTRLGPQPLTTQQRDRLAYFQPKKGSNQAMFPERPKNVATVTQRAAVSPLVFPPDDGPCESCENAVTMRATFSFYVPAVTNKYASGKIAVSGYAAIGLERSFDGGKTWSPWIRLGNDLFRSGTFSITAICDGETAKHIPVRAFASQKP